MRVLFLFSVVLWGLLDILSDERSLIDQSSIALTFNWLLFPSQSSFSETDRKCTCRPHCCQASLPSPSFQSGMRVLDQHRPVQVVVGRLLPQLGNLLLGDPDQPVSLPPRLHRHQAVNCSKHRLRKGNFLPLIGGLL